MSRTGVLILLGVVVILTPFSGFPIAMRSIAAVLCGAAVVAIGLTLRVREQQKLIEMPSTPPPVPSTEPEQPHSPSSVSPI